MGSVFEYISIEKAAESLSVSRRQIYRYIKKGRLRTAKKGQNQLVLREDITSVLKEKEEDSPPIALNKNTLRRQDARIHMLEKRVSLLMRLHDLHNDPLKTTAVELKSFYEMAEYCLAETWSPHQEQTWVDFFVRLQLEDLEKLSTVIQDDDPWLMFHSLCCALLKKPHDSDYEVQLRAGKAHLEQLAYVWATSNQKNSKELDRVIQGSKKRVNKVVRRVTTRRSKI